MCDPISIAGAALTGAGMAENAIGSNAVQSSINSAEQQEQYLNGVQQQRINQANSAALGNYSNFQQGQTAEGKSLGDFLQANSTGAAPPKSYMAPTDANTQNELSTQNSIGNALGTQQARSLGNVRSFGDYLASANRGAARNLQTADQGANFMQGNANVLGLQLHDAQQAGNTNSLLGSIGTALGGLGIKAGISGAGSKLGNLFAPSVAAANGIPSSGLFPGGVA